jgi:hypothetical protein
VQGVFCHPIVEQRLRVGNRDSRHYARRIDERVGADRKNKLRFRQCPIIRILLSSTEAWRKTPALGNIVIDNYLFGVASVSKDGYESPVVFPGATGSFGE